MTANISELAAPAIKPLVWRDHRPDSFPEPAWSALWEQGVYAKPLYAVVIKPKWSR